MPLGPMRPEEEVVVVAPLGGCNISGGGGGGGGLRLCLPGPTGYLGFRPMSVTTTGALDGGSPMSRVEFKKLSCCKSLSYSCPMSPLRCCHVAC